MFSYIEYQALVVSLAGFTCACLGGLEIALNRFHVLPLLFPGMFSVHERRFRFFSFDVSDGAIGKIVRQEAKMVTRLTMVVVLSYLWSTCVMQTRTIVGVLFPQKECDEGYDCFASELNFMTMVNRQYAAIDCKNPADSKPGMVISCVRFITPEATNWLMHLAIAHSVTQLNFKCYEVLVWIAGNSNKVRMLFRVVAGVSGLTLLALFFAGVMSEFLASWLSFVMIFAVPMFMLKVYNSAKMLDKLWHAAAESMQQQMENHLAEALQGVDGVLDPDDLSPGNAYRPHVRTQLSTSEKGGVIRSMVTNLSQIVGVRLPGSTMASKIASKSKNSPGSLDDPKPVGELDFPVLRHEATSPRTTADKASRFNFSQEAIVNIDHAAVARRNHGLSLGSPAFGPQPREGELGHLPNLPGHLPGQSTERTMLGRPGTSSPAGRRPGGPRLFHPQPQGYITGEG